MVLKDFMAARGITARRKIPLDRTARVIGDLATPGIATRSGRDSLLDRILGRFSWSMQHLLF
jgi:hypothetical protein